MKIKIHDLLSCKYFEGSEVLAGDQGTNKVVASIIVLETTKTPDYLRGGELLLSSGFNYCGDENLEKDLVEGLSASGAAGLCLDLGFFENQEIPAIMKQTADRLDFPIISFPVGYVFTDICDFMNNNLFSPISKEIKRQDEAIKEINDYIYKENLLGLLKGLHSAARQGRMF